MGQFELAGALYRDDRMYVMKLATDFVKEPDGMVVVKSDTLIDFAATGPAVLITYRNLENLPATRVDEFNSVSAAVEYIMETEPTCPKVSLGGRSPNPQLSWSQHLDWLHSKGLLSAAEGDAPNPSGFPDGDNPREMFLLPNKSAR